MDNKKHIVDLELFRDILHICTRVHGQSFAETPFEEEILAFIRFLGHSVAIRTLTDVNINKLYQSWRSFATIINKCLTAKSSGYDSLRLSQAQILWGLYHKRNVDYAYLMWEDFVYQEKQGELALCQGLPYVLHNQAGEVAPKPKDSVRRTRSSFDTSITPPTAAASPRLTASTKGKQTAKASKAKSLSALSEPSGLGTDEGTGSKPGVPDGPTDESEEELSWNSTDDESDDNEEKNADGNEEAEGDDSEEGNGDDDDEDDDGEEGDDDDANQEVVRDDDNVGMMNMNLMKKQEESFDPIPQTPKDSKDDDDDEEDLSLNIGEEEIHDEEEKEDKLYRDVNINQGRGIQATLKVEDSYVTLTLVKPDGQQESSSVSSQFVTSMLNLTLDVGMESIFETTSQLDVQTPTSVAPLPMPTPTITPSTNATITTTSQAPILPTIVLSTIIQNLLNFSLLFRFDDRLRSLEANISEAMQTNQFAGAVSVIFGIVHQYMDQRMNEAVKVAVQIQSDHLRDEAQRDNDEFLKIVDENMKKIIKEQFKVQVKVQVLKILPRVEQAVNEQLEAKVLTRSSHSSRTSYPVDADLSEMELKKILIQKIEGNKAIQRSDEQRNLYKALVDAYESDKIILDIYEETVTLKRRRDDAADKDEEPFAGPDRGSKRRRKGKEPESASALMETATRSVGRSTQGSRSRQASASESALAKEPMQTTSQMEEPSHPEFDTGADDQPIVQSSQHHEWFSQQQKPLSPDCDWNKTLSIPLPFIPNNRGRHVIPFEHFINKYLEYRRGGASSRKYTTSITKTKAGDYGHIKWIEELVPRTMWIQETKGYDKHALWEFPIRDVNVSSSTVLLLTGNLLAMYIPREESSLLMRIDKLHKFSDGTLTDVRTALDDRLKGIQMQYLPQLIWRNSDKDRAAAMIQAIDKRLKTRKIMRSLERVSPLVETLSQKFGIISKDTFQQPQLITIRVIPFIVLQASLSNQTNEIKNIMASLFQMNTASTFGSGSLPSNTVANPKGEIKAITTQRGIILDGSTILTPPPFINQEEDERIEETLTDPDLSEYTIKVPPPPDAKKQQEKDEVQIHKFWHMFKQLHVNITLADALILMPKYQKMLKALLSNKEKLQELANMPLNENCSAKLGLPELISTRMTLQLANRAICTPAEIARDVFVSVGKFTFPADFVIVNYESDPRVPLILGRPFLWTARALIDVHGEEMILRDDFLEDLFSINQPSGNPTFLSRPESTSLEVNYDTFEPEEGNVLTEKLLDLDSTKDLHPHLHVNPLSGSTTYSSSPNPLLEVLADEHALITFPPKYDDDLQFDVELDLKEIEFLLHQDIDSILKDSINQSNHANPGDNFVDSMPEMLIDEHAIDYSSPTIFDEYEDDFLEVESDTENVYDDPFDSKGEKIKESKLLIDELDLPCDFLPSSDMARLSLRIFPGLMLSPQPKMRTSIPGNLKTHAEGFCPPVFISSASLGNHVSKSNRANIYLMA
uniref:Reverse transcriptase domain-containing protein n=1 Tax=Tanacetum cinerariifolium TaxID=118510 RepID=A0A6L2P3A0_TANCI|nr:hypothetical protein [Tanacetum cinerariifolium]